MDRFKTKTVVITGAGSGLGRGIALAFGKLGWRVAVSDIDMVRAEESARFVDQAGGQAMAVRCDVTRPEEVQSLADKVVTQWETVDIIVNNAGVPVLGMMENIGLEDWKYEIDIMLMSVVYGCRSFIPIFRKQGYGHIVNVASFAGIISMAEMAAYNVTKAGVISLSETLSVELYGANIGVTVVCPTFFKTNLMDQARVSDAHTKTFINAVFAKLSFGTVESVTKNILKAIRKDRLYAIPQPDAKFYWVMKRLMPQTFRRIFGFTYSHRFWDMILGI